MGIEIKSAVVRLIEFWRAQQIVGSPATDEEIHKIQKQLNIKLPTDFEKFYLKINGMETLYPNEIDKEGFLFYPLHAIVSATTEFENAGAINKDNIFIFAEYMHKSWWYGFEIINEDEYIIGILPHENKFKSITNSLAEFIELYIEDSDVLYDYERN